MRTAIVEVGTASLRLVVVEAADGGWFRLHADHRVVLGLQRAVRRDGCIGEGLLQLVEETARRLRELAFRAGADTMAGYLAAGLCEATDVDELRLRTARALGCDVRAVGFVDEAAALVEAIRRSTAPDLPTLVIDLGDHELRAVPVAADGAVGEVARTCGGTRDLLPAGAVDPFHPAVRHRLRARLVELLADLAPAPIDGADGATWPVVTGPVADALARAAVARRWGRGGPVHDGTRLSRVELVAFETELASSSQTQRMLLPAIDPVEVDLAGLAVVLVEAVVDRLDAPGVVVSGSRAHEGVVLEALGLREVPPGDVRERAVGALTEGAHAGHTAGLAGSLFDQLGALHQGGPDDRRLLVDAALLHDRTGHATAEADHRTGAAALLEGGVRGCGPRDLIELAALVRFQRGRAPGPELAPFGRLPARRRELVRRLTALLRLACGLDEAGGGAVCGVTAHVDGGVLELTLHGAGDVGLARHGVQRRLRAVEDLLGVRVVLGAGSRAPLGV
jgi:exopolyphosphatase / guanosine-5'-triphosphate,3'-diphosphate pyrophosphatase